ncbi:MAG: methyltransferase domain-containing protein [Gammaproteobacteria bacterium]|nr:methyltransferase domain-containing protein [Gammaproteobacteria bacterium]
MLAHPDNELSLREWFAGPVGAYLLGLEGGQLAALLPGLFGYHLVTIGRPADTKLVESSRIHHRLLLSSCAETGLPPGTVVAAADSLPLASDAIDVIVLPHMLEFARNPHRILREVERALIGEGHLVVLALNPWSLFGLWRWLLCWRGRSPWNGNFYSAARIRDWLSLLDFDVVAVHRCAFRPPLRRAMGRFGWLENLGAALWPALGASMIIVARKRVIALTPVKMRWQSRRTLIAAGMAEPSTRGSCE